MIPSGEKEWSKLVEGALKKWNDPAILNEHPLTKLNLVNERYRQMFTTPTINGHAKALREVLRDCIRELGPEQEKPPSHDDDLKWMDPIWRPYSMLTLLFIKATPSVDTQARLGLGEGGHYFRERKKAIKSLARVLENWESGRPKEQIDIGRNPTGAVGLDSKFYIERPADRDLLNNLNQSRIMVTIRGSRQVGKTSLLIRGKDYIRSQSGASVVDLTLQNVDKTRQASLDQFLFELACRICDAVGLEEGVVENAWRSRTGVLYKMTTRLMEQQVLPQLDRPLVLAFDEIDNLLMVDYGTEFFSMLRTWHDKAASNPDWNKLKVMMVISTDPILLIDDISQSPFNVGLRLYLTDFDEEQVGDLNQRYGSSLPQSNLPQFMDLFGGQPFLTRMALYWMSKESLSWDELAAMAPTRQGPFSVHLQWQLSLLGDDQGLRTALKAIARDGSSADKDACNRLLKAGFIREDGDGYRYRCQLYRAYFVDRL